MQNNKALHDLSNEMHLNYSNQDDLVEQMSKSRFVLMGEASHGTAEFYRERINLSKELIKEFDFDAVVIEGDWPDTYRLTQYINGETHGQSSEEALFGFMRFPTWMWRNEEMLHFIQWLKQFNDGHVRGSLANKKISIYGMDLYSMFTSMDLVVHYLKQIDPTIAQRAKKRFACFDHFQKNAQLYGYLCTYSSKIKDCKNEVIDQLIDIIRLEKYAQSLSDYSNEQYFSTVQNVKLVKNAERYYRTMFSGKASSWNLRDHHMVEVIADIDRHISKRKGSPAKIIVWAHNSHIGDASFTQQGRGGEISVGQLMRVRYPNETFLLGFTTYTGTVTAASEWDGVAERKEVQPGMAGSFEKLFHDLEIEKFYLIFKNFPKVVKALPLNYLERAIGVVYLPETERQSHYFYSDIAKQFDAIIHIDKTSAVKPLELLSKPVKKDVPETYPSGF